MIYLTYLVFGIACFIAGLSKGGLAGSLGFLITPLLTLFMPLNRAVGTMLPALILADLLTLAVYWRGWDTQKLGVLLAGAVVGVTAATFVLTTVSPALLKKALGVLVIVFGLYRLLEARLVKGADYQVRTWHGLLAGSVSGFASTLANAGGPPVAIYLLLQKLEPKVFIPTAAVFFALLNWIKVPYYAATGVFDWAFMIQFAWLLPLVLLGVWTGKAIASRLDRVRFERVVVGLVLVSGVLLLVRG